MCHVPINVTEMNIDLLSASAHKFHGPKGVGFMYMKNTAKLEPFIHGGAQERARRAGTSNVPGIVGMGQAVKLALCTLDKDTHTIINIVTILLTGFLVRFLTLLLMDLVLMLMPMSMLFRQVCPCAA